MAETALKPDFGEWVENDVPNEKIIENVMAVELAIKRELAYQRRIEKLQLEPSTDIKEVHRHPQNTSNAPSSSLVGLKRKEPSYTPQCSPLQSSGRQPLPKQSSTEFCKLCQVTLSTSFREHRDTSEHQAKYKMAKSQNSSSSNSGGGSDSHVLWCEQCNVPCSGKPSLVAHLAGKKHATRVMAIMDRQRSQRRG